MPNPPTTEPTTITLGRVTISGDTMKLEPALAHAAQHAADQRMFADRILGGLLFVDDLDRAVARATMYLEAAIADSDVDQAETWGSIMHALQHLARRNGADILRGWRPVLDAAMTLSQEAATTIAAGDAAAEAEAAEALAAERARLISGQAAPPPQVGLVEHLRETGAVVDPLFANTYEHCRGECLICGVPRKMFYECGCSRLKVDEGMCDDNTRGVCEDCQDTLIGNGYDIDRESVIVVGPDATFRGTLRELFSANRDLGNAALAVVPGTAATIDNELAGQLTITRLVIDGEAADVGG